jgi:hypothetical protein
MKVHGLSVVLAAVLLTTACGANPNGDARSKPADDAWSAPVPIDGIAPGAEIQVFGLRLVGTEEGGALAMWTQSGRTRTSSEVWSNTYRPEGGWQAAQRVAAGERPQVVIAPSGEAFATWQVYNPATNNGPFYRGRYVPGQGWIDIEEMSESLAACWTVARNGKALLVSMTKSSVVVRDFDPATGFSAEQEIGVVEPGAENGGAGIDAFLDSQGDAVVFWVYGYDVGRASVTVLASARRVAGFGWQPSDRGSNGPLAGDDHGRLLDVSYDDWHKVTLFSRLTPRDGWSALQNVPAPSPFLLPRRLALNAAGAGVLLLADEDRHFAAVGYDPDKGWGPAGILPGVQESRSRDAAVAVDGVGRGVAIWTEDLDGQARSVWIAAVAPWGEPQRLTPDTGAAPLTCGVPDLVEWEPAATLDDHGGGVAVWGDHSCVGARVLSSFRRAS